MKWAILAIFLLTFTGCMDISPLTPEMNQRINNQDGQIEDIRNNQNGFMLELGKLRNQTDINARDIGNMQQGLINQSNQNSGVQILQGEGPLILVFALGTIAMLLVYHYRTRAVKGEKVVELLSDQIALYDDVNLDNDVFMSALNTEVEEEVYHAMIKSQERTGTTKGQRLTAASHRPKVSRSSLR